TPSSENLLVRAVGRVPLQLRAKLLIGFGIVGALLAIGYVLGFVALGQSNSRGTELRSLQEQAAYDQLLLTDATQIKRNVDYLNPFTAPDQSFVTGINLSILHAGQTLSADAGCPNYPLGTFKASRKGLTLFKTDPPLAQKVCTSPFGIVPSASNIAYED